MIASAPAPSLRSLVRTADVARFGARATAIRDAELFAAGVSIDELVGRKQSRPILTARQDIAYRAWTECPWLSLSAVASLIGRSDHSAAAYAILAGARTRGIAVARVSELRDGDRGRSAVDWTKLAYHAAGWRSKTGIDVDTAARRAGVARTEWRKIEQGRSVSATTLLLACRAIGGDPFTYLTEREPPSVSRQTDGKQEARDASAS